MRRAQYQSWLVFLPFFFFLHFLISAPCDVTDRQFRPLRYCSDPRQWVVVAAGFPGLPVVPVAVDPPQHDPVPAFPANTLLQWLHAATNCDLAHCCHHIMAPDSHSHLGGDRWPILLHLLRRYVHACSAPAETNLRDSAIQRPVQCLNDVG